MALLVKKILVAGAWILSLIELNQMAHNILEQYKKSYCVSKNLHDFIFLCWCCLIWSDHTTNQPQVLSRNHAIMWMNGNNQCLVKDMRSSNGTFINNERLSTSGEESEPKEMFSGDILQLGVEIVDNTKNSIEIQMNDVKSVFFSVSKILYDDEKKEENGWSFSI